MVEDKKKKNLGNFLDEEKEIDKNCLEEECEGQEEEGGFTSLDINPLDVSKDKETGITILDEDPQWYWHREAASGSVVELRLEQENSYMMNIQMGDFQLIDFELGGIESEITIIQSQ